MKTAFLDANVLFSTAYADQASLLTLWKLPGVRLCTSQYALEEARRNLRTEPALARLKHLEEALSVVSEADLRLIPAIIALRDKDKPILAAAIAARANFLLTGDVRDFGVFFGQTIAGVLVLRPRDFIALAAKKHK